MQRGYEPQWVISGAELIRVYNPGLIQESMDVLTVDRWHCTVVTQDAAVVPGGAFTCKERWYETEYHVAPVSASLLDVSGWEFFYVCGSLWGYALVLT